MLRKGSVLLGLAVLLSLIFPVSALLAGSGFEPSGLELPVVDLAAACVLLALLPSFALFRDARLAHRIPRWNLWVGLLALCSVLFLLLHVSWSLELATALLQDATAPGGGFPIPVSHLAIVNGVELAARLGVLVSLVGVLLNLHAIPDEEAPVKRRTK